MALYFNKIHERAYGAALFKQKTFAGESKQRSPTVIYFLDRPGSLKTFFRVVRYTVKYLDNLQLR